MSQPANVHIEDDKRPARNAGVPSKLPQYACDSVRQAEEAKAQAQATAKASTSKKAKNPTTGDYKHKKGGNTADNEFAIKHSMDRALALEEAGLLEYFYDQHIRTLPLAWVYYQGIPVHHQKIQTTLKKMMLFDNISQQITSITNLKMIQRTEYSASMKKQASNWALQNSEIWL
ncbi:hypothetical protein C8Q77DRAFT_1074613 [Trametes polyzona]|nr:hypothetical protein C8Q77DRAFT_1074613 [Trametes polyzona]